MLAACTAETKCGLSWNLCIPGPGRSAAPGSPAAPSPAGYWCGCPVFWGVLLGNPLWIFGDEALIWRCPDPYDWHHALRWSLFCGDLPVTLLGLPPGV